MTIKLTPTQQALLRVLRLRRQVADTETSGLCWEDGAQIIRVGHVHQYGSGGTVVMHAHHVSRKTYQVLREAGLIEQRGAYVRAFTDEELKPMRFQAAIILLGAEHFTLARLHDLVLTSFAAMLADGEPDDDDEDCEPIVPVAALVRLYARSLHDLDYFVRGQEADREWRKGALAGYREAIPDEPKNSEALPAWPDALDLCEQYPRALLRELGYLAGYHDGRQARATYDQQQRKG